MSDHPTPGKGAERADGSNAEPTPLTGEELLAEAVDMVRGLLAAILVDDLKRQQLLATAIGDLDEGGLGLQHALEFLTNFRLRYVPSESLAQDAMIQPDVSPPPGLDDEALRDWLTATLFVTQLWSARTQLRTNPVAEVQVRINLRSASASIQTLVLLVMASAVAEMMAYTADVQGQAFDYYEMMQQRSPEPHEVAPA